MGHKGAVRFWRDGRTTHDMQGSIEHWAKLIARDTRRGLTVTRWKPYPKGDPKAFFNYGEIKARP
jgi:hypothetical protein